MDSIISNQQIFIEGGPLEQVWWGRQWRLFWTHLTQGFHALPRDRGPHGWPGFVISLGYKSEGWDGVPEGKNIRPQVKN